jgi:phosphatidylglycerophosphatase A
MAAFGLAFALFRLFDIWKPFPIGWLDARVPGGFGVMLDDVLAAVYAVVCLLGVAIWL